MSECHSKPDACSISVPGINAVPHEDNLRYFDVEIHGPTQSPYEGQREALYRRFPRSGKPLTYEQEESSSLNCSCPTTIP